MIGNQTTASKHLATYSSFSKLLGGEALQSILPFFSLELQLVVVRWGSTWTSAEGWLLAPVASVAWRTVEMDQK